MHSGRWRGSTVESSARRFQPFGGRSVLTLRERVAESVDEEQGYSDEN